MLEPTVGWHPSAGNVMTVDAELVVQLRGICSKADRALATAFKHIEADDYDFAASRAYYSVFYCLEAVLLTRR